MYRDGGNYKKRGSVIFSNPEKLPADSVDIRLRKMFLQEGLFIARQIRVPEVFLYTGEQFSFDDHCYHEFFEVKSSAEVANDPHDRSINEFMAEVVGEAQRGWREFDPYDSVGSFGWFLAREGS
jgi:hypothetical protein